MKFFKFFAERQKYYVFLELIFIAMILALFMMIIIFI